MDRKLQGWHVPPRPQGVCYDYVVSGIFRKSYVCSLHMRVYTLFLCTLGEKKNTFLPMTNCPSNVNLDALSSTNCESIC